MLQTTLAIIKPDAVARGLAGEILAAVEAEGLRPVALKMLRLSKAQAQGFYAVHKERPFFDSLTDYMSSGPVVCAALRGEDAGGPLPGADGRHESGPGRARHSAPQIRAEP